jgi:hypothetical protein
VNTERLDDYCTHLPALLAACSACSGSVLECGAGHYSTALLHALCAPTRSRLLTLEGRAEWLAKFTYLETDWHALRHVADWSRLDLGDDTFDVALVDHDVAPRGPLVDYLRDRVGVVVLHDSECDYCGYTDALRRYAWVVTDKRSPTWTTVAGMGPRPDWIDAALPGCVDGVPVPYRGF